MFLRLIRLVTAACAVMAMAASALLIVVCVSRAGCIFGLSGLLLSAAFLLGALAGDRRSRTLWLGAGLAFAGWLGVTTWLVLKAPNGRPHQGVRVQHIYAGGRDSFRRYALGNLLPEADQFALGFWLVPAVDSLFTQAQAKM